MDFLNHTYSSLSNVSQQKPPLISVILPAYNAERFLEEAIDSILAQTYKNFELIVLNDGSTDRTEEIILSYNDPRIRYIKNESNLKLIKTLNKGIDLARGKYIARMDADDISLPTRFEKEIDFMETHPDIGACSSKVIHLFSNGKTKLGKYYPSKTPLGCKFCSIFRTPLAHPASFFRADVLKAFKYQEKNNALHIEATVLWGEFALNDIKMSLIDDRLLYYRDNESSICHSYTDLMMKNHVERVCFMLKTMLDLEIDRRTVECIFCNGEYSNSVYSEANKLLDYSLGVFIEKYSPNKRELRDLHNICRVIKRRFYYSWFKSARGLNKISLIIRFVLNELLINN